MRRGVAAPSRITLLLVAAALTAPTLLADEASESGAHFEKRVQRLFASPTPIGPILIANDAVVWRVDVPVSAVVLVQAQGSDTAPFHFRFERMGAAPSSLFVPTTHAGALLGGPGAWRVTIDPAAGVLVDVKVRFVGQAGGPGGAPHAFTLTRIDNDNPCLLPTVCLA